MKVIRNITKGIKKSLRRLSKRAMYADFIINLEVSSVIDQIESDLIKTGIAKAIAQKYRVKLSIAGGITPELLQGAKKEICDLYK